MVADRVTEGVIHQYCSSCAVMVAAKLEVGWLQNMMVSDTSRCPQCGTILWHWIMGLAAEYPPEVKKKPKEQMRLF